MTQTHSDWCDPEPIKQTLPSVIALPANNIPEAYRDWITDVAERMQCPIDFTAVAAVVVTAAIIGAGCGIQPKRKDDWLVIPNLWGGVVGLPGMLKTPAVTEVMRIISQLELEAKENFDAEAAEYYAEAELRKAEKEAIKSAMLKAQKLALKSTIANCSLDILSLKDKLVHVNEPAKPIWRRFKTNDATIEKLSELLADNPRGLLLYRDELMGLLASWEQEGRESDRAFFLEAWNGDGSLTSDRISRGTIHTKNLCISIFGTTQPAKLLHYLNRAIRGVDNDGLLQRFQLLIYPDEPKNWRLVDRAPNKEAKQRAFNIIKNLSVMDFVKHGAIKESQDHFPYFHFDDEAQELFYHWLTELEQEKLSIDDQPILREHLAKYRSLVPSLALIFHLIAIADGEEVSKVTQDSLIYAIARGNYLETHAQRIYSMVTDVSHHAAARLAKKIEDGQVQSRFSVRDVYQKDWALLNNKELVQNACDELIEAGWLKQESTENGTGRPRLPVFVINPKVNVKSVDSEIFLQGLR